MKKKIKLAMMYLILAVGIAMLPAQIINAACAVLFFKYIGYLEYLGTIAFAVINIAIGLYFIRSALRDIREIEKDGE